jgi:protein-disulfide isomerase
MATTRRHGPISGAHARQEHVNDDAPATAAGDGAAPDPANTDAEPAETMPLEALDGESSVSAAARDAAAVEAPAEVDADGYPANESVDSEAAAGEAVAAEAASAAAGRPVGRIGALDSINPARVAGYLGAVLAGALLAGVLFMALGGGAGRPAASPSLVATAAAPTDAPLGGAGSIHEEGSTLGRPSAPVTIEIWSDFQCPYCSLLAHAIEPDLIRGPVAGGEVQLVYNDYVFLGQESLDASVAARCAGRQGEFWRYHDLLFATQRGENQGTFSQQFLASIAGFAALDATQFQQCISDPSVAAGVLADTKKGGEAGVESTPTLIITGPVATRVLRGFPSWSSVMLEIDRAMGRAPIPSPDPTAAAATPAPSGGPSGTTPGPAPSAASPRPTLPGTAAPQVTVAP